MKYLQAPHNPDRRFKGVPPKNVFTINDSYDAAVALYWIENNLLNTQGKWKIMIPSLVFIIHIYFFIIGY